MEPKFRCGNSQTIKELAKELNLPYNDQMQDWSYEVADSNSIEEYLKHYDELFDNDKKFVLMEIIIQATEDQPNNIEFEKYWVETEARLLADIQLHEYTIYYWSCFDNSSLDDCWIITPQMRNLWKQKK